MSPMNRREFLVAGAGFALLAACGSSKDDEATVKVADPDGEVNKPGSRLNLVVASYTHVTGLDERVTMAFLNDDASGPLKPDAAVRFTIDGQDVPSELHTDGIPLPYFLIRHRFDKAGIIMVGATMGDKAGETALQVVDPGSVALALPGRPMIATPSPTTVDARGVDPICTREPACPLHEVSLDAALAEKRPLAVLFATPARCQSKLCGPVLDTLVAERDGFADRVRFIHIEIYAARTGDTLAPAVQASHLEQEPILFLVGADGVVRERLDNAYDRTEARAALGRLVS
ncbi:MAG: hypothetical protein ACRDZW_03335 [Acidimicrobiales bacterium]